MGRKQPDGHPAEVRGSSTASNALDEMRAADSQAERVRILHRAVLDVLEDARPSRAAGGFAVALIAYLDHAMGLE